MEINIKLPAKAVDALENIAHELKELRLSLCPPLRGSTGTRKAIDPRQPAQVQYPDSVVEMYQKAHWDRSFPVERREDQG